MLSICVNDRKCLLIRCVSLEQVNFHLNVHEDVAEERPNDFIHEESELLKHGNKKSCHSNRRLPPFVGFTNQ